MSLEKAMKDLKFDARMIEINLNTGRITKEELKKHLETLPDSTDNSEALEIEEKNDH